MTGATRNARLTVTHPVVLTPSSIAIATLLLAGVVLVAGLEAEIAECWVIAGASHRLRHSWRRATTPFRRVAGPFGFAEGPVWDGERILFTDIPSNRILSYGLRCREIRVIRHGTGGANGLALDSASRLYACEQAARRVARYEHDGTVTVLAERVDGRRLNSPNDLVLDSCGALWFSDPRYGSRDDMELHCESVYRLDLAADDTPILTRVTSDTIRPNGVALSPDERTLYVADSPRPPDGRRVLLAYPIALDRSLRQPTVLVDFGPHRGIDGMCVRRDGRIIAACGWRRSGPGPRVTEIAPDGVVINEYPIAVEPTNVCLAGEEQLLFVTTADGALWSLRVDS